MLVGFDAREGNMKDSSWPDERKKMFLLIDLKGRPLSVDTAVWPSIFHENHSTATNPPPITPPSWRGPVQDLWEDLDALKSCIRERNYMGSFQLVAVDLAFEAIEKNEQDAWQTGAMAPTKCAKILWRLVMIFRLQSKLHSFYRKILNRPRVQHFFWHPIERVPPKTIRPNNIKEDWKLLGYDVADKYLLSGLMNCGYKKEGDYNKFKNSLNEYHLFNSINDAKEFKRSTNARVPEHAPFFVYGLWLIPA